MAPSVGFRIHFVHGVVKRSDFEFSIGEHVGVPSEPPEHDRCRTWRVGLE